MPLRVFSCVMAMACMVTACAGRPHRPAATPALPAADAPQAIPATFMLSTNEPFWQARIEADTVLLTGLQGQRRLAIENNEAVFDGRVVSARDAAGAVELRVTERLCMDSMSGAQFPYTGRLQVDGNDPVMGCGGPLPAAR